MVPNVKRNHLHHPNIPKIPQLFQALQQGSRARPISSTPT
ncbi:uncharacterized protein RAG0_17667 [Rhynchosporium agropyri]|uniref:Uncharacterized protein n=1 Tax=Rhynchosporium agropyri TaxID=914238 RepID=A0A1E1LVN5_9HELO|nr:uncharacterized protein RAG0_17667 [Rhynchosporium agropyri]